MRTPATLRARLADWLAESISHRVRFYSLLLTGGVTILVGLISYLTLSSAVQQNQQQRIAHQSSLVSSAFSLLLNSIAQESIDISRSSLVANGLVDSMGKEVYLTPFFRDHRSSADIQLDMLLLDFHGKPIAASADRLLQDFPQLEETGAVLAHGKPAARLLRAGQKSRLVMVLPIIFPPTRQTEGALLVAFDLQDVFGKSVRGLDEELDVGVALDGQLLFATAGERLGGADVHAAGIGGLQPPLDALRFEIRVAESAKGVLTPLDLLAVTHLLSSFLALLLVYFIVGKISSRLTAPIVSLSDSVSRIAEKGDLDIEVEKTSHDEIGKLTDAFNLMLRNLRTSYDFLEQRVRDRTRELQDSERFNRSILNTATDAFFLLDEHGQLLDANPAFCQLLGYELAELPGLTMRDIECQELPESKRFDVQRLIGAGAELFESCYRAKQGYSIEVEVSARYLPDNGKSFGLVRDLTERKRSELNRYLQAEEQRNALVSEVHHRIKNNLQGMIGLLALESEQNPQAAEAISSVIAKIKSVAVVFGLQGRHDENDIRLQEVVSELCNAAQSLSNADFTLKLDVEGRESMLLDKDKAVAIALVINELITNAVKHNSGGRIGVELGVDGVVAVLKITNASGIGAADFDLEHGVGLGTGLSLVKFMLPREGCKLSFEHEGGRLNAVLRISSPVVNLARKEGSR